MTGTDTEHDQRDSLAASPYPFSIADPLNKVSSESFGLGVPRAFGGQGEDFSELFRFVSDLAGKSISIATTYSVQRHLIEVLLSGRNAAIREYRLPQLLEGDINGACAATWRPWSKADPPLVGRDSGRGWRLAGHVPPIPNLGIDWFLVSVPLQLGPDRPIAVALLSSEQDGVNSYEAELPGFQGTKRAGVNVRNVHFREDEIIDDEGATLFRTVAGITVALRCGLAAGVARSVISRIDNASYRLDAETQLSAATSDLDRILTNRESMAAMAPSECSMLMERFNRAARDSVEVGRDGRDASRVDWLITQGLSII